MTCGVTPRCTRALLALGTVLPGVVLASCSGDSPTSTSPRESFELAGVSYSAEVSLLGPSAERIQGVRYAVTLTNLNDDPVRVPVLGCTVLLRVRAPDGRVVWGEDRGDWECFQEPYEVELGPGESRAIESERDTWSILGDSLPHGPYGLTVVLQLPDRTLELEAGSGDLTSGLEDVAHEIATVVKGDPAELRTTVTVTNVGDRVVRLEYGCGAVRLLAFRSADRSGRPAWDSYKRFGDDFVCPAYLAFHLLESGESFVAPEFRYVVPVGEVLGDSLPEGRYFFRVDFRVNFRTTQLPAGEAVLERSGRRDTSKGEGS